MSTTLPESVELAVTCESTAVPEHPFARRLGSTLLAVGLTVLPAACSQDSPGISGCVEGVPTTTSSQDLYARASERVLLAAHVAMPNAPAPPKEDQVKSTTARYIERILTQDNKNIKGFPNSFPSQPVTLSGVCVFWSTRNVLIYGGRP